MSDVLHPGQQVIDIVLPTYRIEPEGQDRFYPSVAKSIADGVLVEELSDQVYDEEEAKIWSLNISDKVRETIYAHLSTSRYKIVVQTTIGQLKDQGIRIASRCLWDPNTDNYASTSFSNATLFCNVLVFAVYMD